MNDDTTLTSPSLQTYGTHSRTETNLLTDFTQVASSIFKGNSKPRDLDDTRPTRKVRADLVRNYITKPGPENNTLFRRLINFLKG